MADRVFEPEISRSLKRLVDWGRRDLSLGIECKKVETPYLPFDKVREHQVQALLAFERVPLFKKIAVPAAPANVQRRFQERTEFDFVFVPPGRGYLLVNFRFTRKAPRKDLKKGMNRCFALRVGQYIEGRKELKQAGRSSLPLEWFEEHGLELERTRFRREDEKFEYGWNLIPLMR